MSSVVDAGREPAAPSAARTHTLTLHHTHAHSHPPPLTHTPDDARQRRPRRPSPRARPSALMLSALGNRLTRTRPNPTACCAEKHEPTTTTPILRRENGVAAGRPPHTPRHLANLPACSSSSASLRYPPPAAPGRHRGRSCRPWGEERPPRSLNPHPGCARACRPLTGRLSSASPSGCSRRCDGRSRQRLTYPCELATVTDPDDHQQRLRPTRCSVLPAANPTEDGRASHARAGASSANCRLGC